MKRITITLDEKTASWVRAHAASQGTNVSHVVRELVRHHKCRMREYAEAMRRFQSIKPFRADWVGGHRPTRGELYASHLRRGRPARVRA